MPISNSPISPTQPNDQASFIENLSKLPSPNSLSVNSQGKLLLRGLLNSKEETERLIVKAAQATFGVLAGSAILYYIYKKMKVTEIHPVGPITNNTNAFMINFGLSVAAIVCLFYSVKGNRSANKLRSHHDGSGEKQDIKSEEVEKLEGQATHSRSRSTSESDKEKNSENNERNEIKFSSSESHEKVESKESGPNTRSINNEDGFFWPNFEEFSIKKKKYATNHLNMTSYSEANHEFYYELAQSSGKFLDENGDVGELLDLFPLDALYVLRDLQKRPFNGTPNHDDIKEARGEVTVWDVEVYKTIYNLFKIPLDDWTIVFNKNPNLGYAIQRRIRKHLDARKKNHLEEVQSGRTTSESKKNPNNFSIKTQKFESIVPKKTQTNLEILINSPKKTNRNEMEQVDLYTTVDEVTKNVLNYKTSTPKKEIKERLREVEDIAKGSLEFLNREINHSEDVYEAFISNAEELELNIQLSTQYLMNSESIEENLVLSKTQWTKRSMSHFEFFKYPTSICAQIKNLCLCMDIIDSEKTFIEWNEKNEEVYKTLKEKINELSINSSSPLDKKDVKNLLDQFPLDEILILKEIFKKREKIKSEFGLDYFLSSGEKKRELFINELQGWINVFDSSPWMYNYLDQRIRLFEEAIKNFDKTISIIPLYSAPDMQDIITQLEGFRNERSFQKEMAYSPSKLRHNSNMKQKLLMYNENRG